MRIAPHPDANLLSALLDGGLARRERRRVLAHLADCADCRRVTSLAHSALRMDAAAVAPPPPIPWPRPRPVWVAPLATAASIAAAVGLLWLPRAARISVASPVATAVAATSLAPSPAPPSPDAGPLRSRPAPSHPFVLTELAAVPVTLPSAFVTPVPPLAADADTAQLFQPGIDFSPLMSGFQDQPALAGTRSQFAAWAIPSEDAEVSVVASAAAASDAVASPDLRSAAAVAPLGFSDGFAASNPVRSASGPMAPSIETGLGWAISGTGRVLRSVGAGLWAAVPLVPGLHVRALATPGDHVWVAGLASELFVSRDHGSSWQKVALPQAAAHASVPVLSIEFADPDHGAIRAADGQQWTTSDAGLHWASSPRS